MKIRPAFFAAITALAWATAANAGTLIAPAASVENTAEMVPTATAEWARTVAGDPELRRPLARLRAPLCLAVAAADEQFARTVAQRIIDNASSADVPIRAGGCKPNALVTFSDDAHAQLQQFKAEGRKLFKRLSDADIAAALAARDPAYVFQTVQPTPRIGQGDEFADESSNWTKERSILRTPEDLVTALVVIDSAAVAGLSATQLADYASLRLLAPTGELAAEDTGGQHTILSLFANPAAAPEEMTRFDRAYLKTLYGLPRTAFAKEVLEETVAALSK